MNRDHTRALQEVHDLLTSEDPVDRLAEITEIVEEALATDNKDKA